MSITIQILSTSVETKPTAKGSYQMLEVAYKNLTFQGKVESKKIMSFGAQEEAFKALATAGVTSVWDVEVTKNEKGYNDWIKVTKGVAPAKTTGSPAAPSSTTGNATSRGFETPAERAQKQVYIVRQSSLTNAIATLTVGRKSEVKPEEVINLAKQYEAFVFGVNDSAEAIAQQDVGTIESIEEDLPF